MADVVQFKMERMLPEFDDLIRRGLFTRREIAKIAKQRWKHECRLKSYCLRKQDFIDYIEHEKRFERLRLLRKKAMLQKSRSKKWKKSLSDFAGIKRINEIFRLATTRFKGDIGLWFQYLKFCEERRNGGKMNEVLAKAIRFHPKVPGLWIYAAAWEFDQNLNVEAARALMQIGLTVCRTSADLWVEYLRMELTYINKLKARKVALGMDDKTLSHNPDAANEKLWRDENKELFMALDEETKNDDPTISQSGNSNDKVDMLREHALTILQTVYRGAIEALPTVFGLRTRFLGILEAIVLPHSEEMKKEILSELKRDFSKEPEYWDWLARKTILDQNGIQKIDDTIRPEQLRNAIQVFEEGLTNISSSLMFDIYVKFLMEVAHSKHGVTASPEFSSIDSDTFEPILHLLSVFHKAERSGFLTEDLACQYVSFLLLLGRVGEAKKQIEKLCSGELSDSVKLWELRLSIEMKNVQNKSDKEALSSIFKLLRDVLMKVAVAEAECLWLMALKFFSSHRNYIDKLVEIAMTVLTRDGGNDEGFSLSPTIVNFILQRDGIQCARNLYQRFLGLPHPGLALYRNCIEIETNLASVGDKDSQTITRKLYESAISTYSQDVSLWRDYYLLEVKIGTSETAAAIHWRARKALQQKFAAPPPENS